MTSNKDSKSLSLPIDLSSTFAFESAEALGSAVITGEHHLYSRWSNPTLTAVENRIANLEGASHAFLCGAGMAAISLALFSAVKRGGPILIQDSVYGGTHELAQTLLLPMGVDIQRVPIDDLVKAAEALPENGSIHLETPTNPLLRLVDIATIRKAAPHAQISVDATFASPIHLQPILEGADLAVHSATKYLGGHHDVVAGVISCQSKHAREIWDLRKVLGPTLDPAAAHRIWRGLDTLELRVLRQTETALELASRLHAHARVAVVHHPALASHPDHALYQPHKVGAVFSFELNGQEEALKVANQLEHFQHAASLGGVHSLVTAPSAVTHAGLNDAERAATGISAGLLRLAIGIEDVEVLWSDLEQALNY